MTLLFPLQVIANTLLEILLPHCCLFCEKPGTLCCPKCTGRLDFCTGIEAEVYYPNIPVMAVCRFDSVSRKIVHTYKYKGVSDWGEKIAEYMYSFVTLPKVDIVTAVPPDPQRLRKRGFDHTEKIATALAKKIGAVYLPLLEKKRHTFSQAHQTNKKDRTAQTAHIFRLRTPNKKNSVVTGAQVLLVDDVCTTGATLENCKKTLEALSCNCFCIVFALRV